MPLLRETRKELSRRSISDYSIDPYKIEDQYPPEFSTDFTVNGQVVNAYVGWIMTHGFNLVSQCPVMSVPTGFAKSSGVPTGMQIVARPYDEMRVFRAASAFENARRWRRKRPPI